MTFSGTALTLANDASISGLTVGKGGGSVATNTVVGVSALAATNTGGYCNAFGQNALAATTSGKGNIGIGVSALLVNTSGSNNVAIGSYDGVDGPALRYNTTGSNNIAIGRSSLLNNTTADGNVAIGFEAGYTLTTGPANTFVGYRAGKNVGNNGNVTAIGSNALLTCTTGGTIVAVGDDSLRLLTTATNCTAVGQGSASALTTGIWNICLGSGTFPQLTTGDSNIAIGRAAGGTLVSGNNGIYIGRDALASASGAAKENVFGYGLTGKGDATTFIGTVGTSNVYQVNNSASWATTSDLRLKKNIVDNNQGLDVINQIRVRNFEYRTEEEITELPKNQIIKKSGVQLGVIAQELQSVLPDCVKQESTGVLSVDSDNLTWYMINAIKELKAEFDAYKLTHP
jgi:hypothetical protein